MRLYVDTETAGGDIRKGVQHYAESNGAVIIACYAVDGGDVKRSYATDRKWRCDELKSLFAQASEIWAHNATFDREMLALHGITAPARKWRCSMIAARVVNRPASLDALCKSLSLGDAGKSASGFALMQQFSIRQNGLVEPHQLPSFLNYVEYCAQDVEAMRSAILRVEREYEGDWSLIWRDYANDVALNARGLPIDVRLMRGMLKASETLRADAIRKLDTVDGIDSPSQTRRILERLNSMGVEAPNLNARTVTQLLKNPALPEIARNLLEARQSGGSLSLAKLPKLAGMLSATRIINGIARMRNCYEFYGAQRTGRWSSRGMQVHNLPRPSSELDAAGTLDASLNALYAAPELAADLLGARLGPALVSGIRGLIFAPEGYMLVTCDYSSIESRVLAWRAGEQWKIDAYKAGVGVYELVAANMFGLEIGEVTKALRQIGKVADLSLGYQGFVDALLLMCEGYSIDLAAVCLKSETFIAAYPRDAELDAESFARFIALAWRSANPNIVQYWKATEREFRTRIGQSTNGSVSLRLPSGRCLHYRDARLRISDRHGKPRSTITYSRVIGSSLVPCDAYGGSLVENETQAIAADLLAYANDKIETLFASGEFGRAELVGHKHDEIIAVVPANKADSALAVIKRIMSTAPAWAAGLPIAAAGKVCKRFGK